MTGPGVGRGGTSSESSDLGPMEFLVVAVVAVGVGIPLLVRFADHLRAEAVGWLVEHGLAALHHPLLEVPGSGGAGLTWRGAAAAVGLLALAVAGGWLAVRHARAVEAEEP